MSTNCLQLKKDFEEIVKLEQDFDSETEKQKENFDFAECKELKERLFNKINNIKWQPEIKEAELKNWVKKVFKFDNAPKAFVKTFVGQIFIIDALRKRIIKKGRFDLSNSSCEDLPDDLIIKGGLNLRSSSIKHLPKNLAVKGWLNLEHTTIKILPESLEVEGDIFINISLLPEAQRLKKEGKIKGEIEVLYT